MASIFLLLGKVYITWLMIVTASYTYNCWVIPLRICFPYQTKNNVYNWMYADYSMDLVYILDLILVKSRVMYLKDGFWIQDYKLTRHMYCHKCQCKVREVSRKLQYLYSVRGLERSELGGSHGFPGRLWGRFL